MMKKFLFCFFLYIVMMSLCISGFALPQKKILSVVIPKFDMPLLYEQDSNHHLKGLEINLLKKIAEKGHYSLKIMREGEAYDDLIDAIAHHRADIAVGTLSKTLDRGKKVYFSSTYLTFYRSVMFNRLWMAQQLKKYQQKGWGKAQVILNSSYRLGVVSGSSYMHFAKNMFPRVDIHFFHGWAQMIQALYHHQIDAVFYDDFAMKEFFLKHPAKILEYEAIVFKNYPDEIGIAVSFKKPELLHWLNLFLHIEKISYNADDVLKSSRM